MRIDDLDTPRNQPGSLASIIEDLHWLGIDWDEGPEKPGPHAPYYQSKRLEHYRDWFSGIGNLGLVYRCFCSRKDIATAMSAPHASDSTTVYPGTCGPGNAKTTLRPETDEHAWRFLVGDTSTRFDDEVLGPRFLRLDTAVGDFVLLRRDGLFAYQLACAADDHLMEITDVVRGADLVDSTHRQIAIMDALGLQPPRYCHIPLLEDSPGKRMSKRDGSNSLEQWREENGSAADLAGWFASSLGFIDQSRPISSRELLQQLDPQTFRYCLRKASADTRGTPSVP